MYCTNAASTLRALPQLAVVHIPDGVNVRSAYGTGARAGSAAGACLVTVVLGAEGRRILHAHVFD
jgi:hypothetical protein